MSQHQPPRVTIGPTAFLGDLTLPPEEDMRLRRELNGPHLAELLAGGYSAADLGFDEGHQPPHVVTGG